MEWFVVLVPRAATTLAEFIPAIAGAAATAAAWFSARHIKKHARDAE